MPVVANPADSCRVAAERMALAGVKRLPVVDPSDPGRLVGIVTLGDLLQARQRLAEEEDRRERFIDPGRFAPGFRR
jgi:CBS-domain-containing membrane protein